MCRWRSALNYLAGLVYGDGTLYYYRRNNEYFTYVYDNNRDFLENVGEIVRKALKVNYTVTRPSRTKNYYRLQFTSKKIYDYVKKLIEERPRKPTKNFIRGFLDAEGSLTVDRKGRVVLEIANRNREVIETSARWLSSRGIKCTVTKHRDRKGVIYKVRVRGWENVGNAVRLLNPLHPKIRDKFRRYLHLRNSGSSPRPPP